jgi:hypothetical protein
VAWQYQDGLRSFTSTITASCIVYGTLGVHVGMNHVEIGINSSAQRVIDSCCLDGQPPADVRVQYLCSDSSSIIRGLPPEHGWITTQQCGVIQTSKRLLLCSLWFQPFPIKATLRGSMA